MSSNSADESEVFKDLLSKIANNAFSKVTDKANALDRMLNIWNDENHRRELLNDLDDRKNLIEHIGYCVRSVRFNLFYIYYSRSIFRNAKTTSNDFLAAQKLLNEQCLIFGRSWRIFN
jgi:hypothetical protein